MDQLNAAQVEASLENALTEFDQSFEKKEYPAFVLPEFVPIESVGGYGGRYSQYGELDGRGDLDDGLIGDSTSSTETVDVNVEMIESPIKTWAKSTQWNIQALYEAQEAGLPLDTWKLENLRNNAMQTLQKVGFKGHVRDNRLQGLLNNSKIGVSNIVPAKPLDQMTGEELRAFFVSIFKAGYSKSGANLVPDTLAIDAVDLMTLRTITASNIITTDGGYTSALTQIEAALSDIAGRAVSIKGIPNNFAQKAGADGVKSRAVVYTNESDILRMNVPVMPENLGDLIRKNVLTFESTLYMRFGGVDIRQPDLVSYVDYSSTAP